MRIGVYGGTFNPPHLGHMASAKAAMAALELDKLFFVPAALPPHKVLPQEGAGEWARLEMTALMADSLGYDLGREDDVSAIDLELQRRGKSYTADTLAQLHATYPKDALWLLVGADMFLTLQDWREPEVILSLAGVAAFARAEGDSVAQLNAQAERLRQDFGAKVTLIPLPQITEVSSTEVRSALEEGRDVSADLPEQVYGYILRNGLYGARADLKNLSDGDLRRVSYSMIRAKRVAHIRGTEQAAVELGSRWGADVERARRAAILHDCTKYLNMEEQLRLCRQYGVALDTLEQSAVKLLHAKTGAWTARDIFGVDEDIFGAIYWHTTGRANMTLLEKVIYLADYMEPTRDFPGVEKLRTLAKTDLDAAVLMGLEMSIEEMRRRSAPVHRNTVEARAWMLDRQSGE